MTIDSAVAALIAETAVTGASSVVRRVAGRVRRMWRGTEGEVAFRNVLERSLTAGLEGVLTDADIDMARHVTSVLERFLASPGVPDELLDMIAESPVPGLTAEPTLNQFRSLFCDAGFEVETLAAPVNLDGDAFLVPFLRELRSQLNAAASQPASPLFNRVAVSRLDQIASILSAEASETRTEVAQLRDSIEGLRDDLGRGGAAGTAFNASEPVPIPPKLDEELASLATQDVPGARLLRSLFTSQNRTGAAVIREAFGREIPSWLAEAYPRVRELAADLANAYNAYNEAAALYESMADDGLAPRASHLVRAALAAFNAGQSEEAYGLLERARQFEHGEWLAGLCLALLEGRMEDVLSVTDRIPEGIPQADNHLAIGLRAQALESTGNFRGALALLTPMLDSSPHTTSVRLLFAQISARGAAQLAGDEREELLKDAEQNAVMARDHRREWHGPSWEAVAVACQASLMKGLHDRVLRYGLMPPDGEATFEESQARDVTRYVAIAWRNLGEIDKAREVAERTGDEYTLVLLQDDESIDPEARWRSAYDTAASELQQSEAQFNLARLGVQDIPGLDEMEQTEPERYAVLQATALRARGDPQAAARLLRPLSSEYESAAWCLVHAYDDDGLEDAAARQLQRIAEDFGSTRARLERIRRLARSERWEEALSEAATALSRSPGNSDMVQELRLLAAEAAFYLSRWGESEDLLRRAIDESAEMPEARWMLVAARWNRRDFLGAWEAMTYAPALEPATREQLHLYVHLRARFAPESETILDLVSIANQHFEDEETAALAINSIFRITIEDQDADFDPAAIEAWHEVIGRFTSTYPESIYLQSISGDIESQIAAMREIMLPGAALGRDIELAVFRGSMPHGLLAVSAGRSVAQAFIQRGGGVIPVGAPIGPVLEDQKRKCREHLDGGAVLDISALHTMSLIPTLWDSLIASFEAVELTSAAYADLIETQDALALPAVGMLSVDPGSGELIHAEIPEETSEQLRLRSSWMVRKARTLRIREVGDRTLFESHVDGDPRFSWLLPIDRAREAGLPLIADDVAIRGLAADQGVPAFSTVAWLITQTEDGHIEEEVAKEALRDLARGFVVDLPFTRSDILELAAEENFQIGPASAILTRASTWSNLDEALGLYGNLLELAEAEDRSLVRNWLSSGAIGLASIHRPGLEAVGVGILLGSTISTTRASREEIAAWLDSVRRAMKLQGWDADPLNAMVWHLARKYVAAFGELGGMIRLRAKLSGLSEADQFSALRTLDKFTGRSTVWGIESGAHDARKSSESPREVRERMKNDEN